MKKFIISIILFSAQSFADTSIDITCKKLSTYSYINGIMNEKYIVADSAATLIKNKLKIFEQVKVAFNQSKGGGEDVLAAIFQKLEESSSI